MSRKNSINDFVDSQYNNPGHRTGRGVGEGLSDLARHRKPGELGFPLIVIGAFFTILIAIGIVSVILQHGVDRTALFPLVALGIFSTVLFGVGVAMQLVWNKPKKRK